MEFESQSYDSLIQKFALLEYNDGSLNMRIHCNLTQIEVFEDYLKSHQIQHSSSSVIEKSCGIFRLSGNISELRQAFLILAQHNTIPQSYFSQILGIFRKEQNTL